MRIYIKTIFILCFLTVFSTTLTARDATLGYTEEHPLIIVSDWDFQPFEFVDTDGKPAGYNIEVLDMIFNNLGIPHRFLMVEWHTATRMFENHEADLIHALAHFYDHDPYSVTKKYVNYYNMRVARRLDKPHFSRLEQLSPTEVLGIKKNDYAELYFNELGGTSFKTKFLSPKDGLTEVRRGRTTYFIWGEIPLKSKLQALGLDSIALDEIDIPAGELRIVGHNKALVDLIDDQYTRLEQAGELQKAYDKWFHPERVHDDASPVTLFLLAGLLAAVVILLLLSRITSLRIKSAVRRSNDLNSMMTQALNMGEYYVTEYDIKTGHVSNVYGDLLPSGGMHIDEFVGRIDMTGQDGFLQALNRLKRGEIHQWTLKKRWNAGTAKTPEWKHLYGEAIIESDDHGPRYIVNTLKDITRETEQEQQNKELGARYMQIFETSLVAASFYDAHGRLINLNQRMRELYSCDEQHIHELNLFEAPLIKDDFDPASRDPFYVCQHLTDPAFNIDKYIEFRIQPVYDDSDKLAYYVVSCSDATARRSIFMQQQEHSRQQQAIHADINHYEEQLHYLLEESNMFVWSYDMEERRISFSRTLKEFQYSESLEEYFQTINKADRQEAIDVFKNAVLQGKPFSVIHHFDYTLVNHDSTWYSISGMPLKDKEGKITRYFGIVRDISYMMGVQEQLRRETDRAENSGLLKSAFLANMTHEIRTPLNAIVGFSDLLHMVDSDDDRKEFIRIIRNNCDMLLRLINDIIEASSMEQSMTIESEPVDFARVFDDICPTLEQRVQESGVPFIKDNPYSTLDAVLDKGRVQQILTNFVTNAVKYTKQGHIRVGYRAVPCPAQDGESVRRLIAEPVGAAAKENEQTGIGLLVYCEDTGTGIPRDQLSRVFERFVKLNDYVQGTGLGLSICKNIIERCNGKIGVESDEGQGSTFWFWIPV